LTAVEHRLPIGGCKIQARLSMRNAHVLLLYNEPVLPAGHPDAESENDVLDTVEVIQGILNAGEFRVERLGVGRDLQPLLDRLREDRPDAVFNLFEGLADRPFTESVVAGILEWLDIPFTGSPSEALTLARNKERAKLMMRGANLPTPPFFTIERLPVPICPLPWPVIVKPADQDASVGIEQASVVTNQAHLEARVTHVLNCYGAALVEQFIAGREIQVSLVETTPGPSGSRELQSLPFAEIEFTDPTLWPIYSYDAKWSPTSREHEATPLRVGVSVPPEWSERIVDVACRSFRLLGCRDYARVDLRVTERGEPLILEVNTNPFIYGVELTEGLPAIGKSHPDFIRDLVRAALARGQATKVVLKRKAGQPKTAGVRTVGRRVRARRARSGGENVETA
jgi:D-alanine-D-alanine ligase